MKIRSFLKNGWGENSQRQALQGDASSRSYETVTKSKTTRLLMNAPRQPDGPIIRDGKPYSQIAHLAEDISAFVGVTQILKDQDIRVPQIYHLDLSDGLILLEDLGPELIINPTRNPISERYLASADMMASYHDKPIVRETLLPDGNKYRVQDYDREAMLIEVDLFAQWYAPRMKGERLTDGEYQDFLEIWNKLIDTLENSEKKLALRDFHSPNIIWRPGEAGHHRVAVIDYQDGLVGPSAYDIASLAQDARVDIPLELEQQILSRYCAARTEKTFDETQFRNDYSIMALQRATKILGIFIRLDERDGKPAYLKHLPRMQEYVKRSISNPVLAEYRNWLQTVMGL